MKAIIRQCLLYGVFFGFLLLVLLPWSHFFSGDMDLSSMLQLPSVDHPLGTDSLGRDLLVRMSQAFYSAVLPLWGICLLCCLLGTASSYTLLVWTSEGWRQQMVTGLKSASVIVVALPITIMVFLVAAWVEQAGLLSLMLPLGLMFLLRSFLLVFELYQQDEKLGFWQAAIATGMSRRELVWRYGLLGHWRESLLQQWFFSLKVAVVVEASLGFLGFGIQEPVASFGNILAAHFDLYLKGEWYILLLVVLGFFVVSWFPEVALKLGQKWLRPSSEEERRSY